MAENKLPIQIEIIPPDVAQITRAMKDIQQKVEASGRQVGQTASVKRVQNELLNQQKAQGAALSRLNRDQIRATIKDKEREVAQLKLAEKQKAAELLAQQKLAAREYEFIAKKQTQAIIKDKEREAAERKRLAAEIAKAERDAARRASPEFIHSQAGLTSPQERISKINAVKQAQKLANEELRAGTIGLGQYNLLMSDATKRLNLFEFGNVRARGAIHKFTARLASLTFELTGAIYGFTILATTLASPMLFGVNFARKLEDTKLGMTGILLAMGAVNSRFLTFAEASAAANEQIDILAREAINLSGTLDDFSRSYQAILAPGLAAGLKLDEIRKVAIAGTVAVKTIGLDSRQIVQEIRDLVAGGIQAASSTLATSLGLTDKDIKAAKLSSEGLFKFLTDRLKGFTTAAERRSETLSGKIEQTWEIIVRVLERQSQGAVNTIKDIFDTIQDKIAIFEELPDGGIGKFIEFRPEFVESITKVIDGLTLLTKVLFGVVEKLFEYKNVILSIAAAKVGIGLFTLLTSNVKKYTAALTGAIAAQKALGAASFIGPLQPGRTATTAYVDTATTAATVGKRAILGVVRNAGLVGIILWGLYEAYGWWKNWIDGPIKDVETAAEASARRVKNRRKEIHDELRSLQQQLGGVRSAELPSQQSVLPSSIRDLDRRIADYKKAVESTGGNVSVLKTLLSQLEQKRAEAFENFSKAVGDQAAERARQIKDLEDRIKALNIELDKLETPSKIVSDGIQRMGAAIIRAKQALDNLNLGFSKGINEGEKYSNALLAFAQAESEIARTRELVNKASDPEQTKKYNEQLKEREKILEKLKIGLKFQNQLEQAKLDVITANVGKEKQRAQIELQRLEKLIPLYGEEKSLTEALEIATSALNKEKTIEGERYKELLETRLKIIQANIAEVKSYDPLIAKERAYIQTIQNRLGKERTTPTRGSARAGNVPQFEENYLRERAKLLNDAQKLEQDILKNLGSDHQRAADLILEVWATVYDKLDELREIRGKEEKKYYMQQGIQIANSIASIIDTVSQIYQAKAARQIDSINEKYNKLAETVRTQVENEVISREQGERRLSTLEKQREREADEIGRKAFERNKKLQRAITIINTAAAVVNALATVPFPAAWGVATAAGIAGAGQLAIINGTSYQGSGSGSFGGLGSSTTSQPNNIIPQPPTTPTTTSGPTIIINNPTTYNVDDTVQFFADVFKQATDDQLVTIQVGGEAARVV